MTLTENEETYRETRATDEMVVGEQVTLSTLVILIRKMCVSSDFGKSIPQASGVIAVTYLLSRPGTFARARNRPASRQIPYMASVGKTICG